MTVHVYEALAPGGEVEEGVGLLVYAEGALVVAGGLGVAYCGVCLVGAEFIGVGEEIYVPALELGGGRFAIGGYGGEFNAVGDTLEVLDGATEVDAAHSLYEDVEHGAFTY